MSTGTSPSPSRERPPSRALTPATWERLTTQPGHIAHPVQLPPLVQRRCLTPAEEHQSIQRLGEESIARKKYKAQVLDRRVYGDPEGEKKTLDPEAFDQMLIRVYQQGVKDHSESRRRLRKKYLAQYELKPKKIDAKTMKDVVLDRLYNTAEKDKVRSEELFGKYNPKRQFLKRTKDEMSANDKRYYEGGFARHAH